MSSNTFVNNYIYYASLTSSGSDTVTATFSSTLQTLTGAAYIHIYEVSGVTATGIGTGTGSGTIGGGSSGTVSTSSTAFQSGAFLVAIASENCLTGVWAAGSGFTLSPNPPFDQNFDLSMTEYATSGVSTPTTFPATLGPSSGGCNQNWVEAGIALQPGITISNSGNIEVIAGQSNQNSIQFQIPSGEVVSVTVSCSGLPSGASCSTNPSPLPGPFQDGDSFELIVNTLPSTPPGTYPITVEVSFNIPAAIIQPAFSLASNGGFSLGPKSISIQQVLSGSASTTFNLIVDPAPAIPEYPLGLPLLAIFMIIAYGLIKRRTRNPKNI